MDRDDSSVAREMRNAVEAWAREAAPRALTPAHTIASERVEVSMAADALLDAMRDAILAAPVLGSVLCDGKRPNDQGTRAMLNNLRRRRAPLEAAATRLRGATGGRPQEAGVVEVADACLALLNDERQVEALMVHVCRSIVLLRL